MLKQYLLVQPAVCQALASLRTCGRVGERSACFLNPSSSCRWKPASHWASTVNTGIHAFVEVLWHRRGHCSQGKLGVISSEKKVMESNRGEDLEDEKASQVFRQVVWGRPRGCQPRDRGSKHQIVVESGKSAVKVPARLVSGTAPSLARRRLLSCYVLAGQGESKLSDACLHKGPRSSGVGASTLGLHLSLVTSLRPHLQTQLYLKSKA